MPITHDGISCPLPPNPVWVAGTLAIGASGGWLAWDGSVVPGVALVVASALLLVTHRGIRRVRVIQSKLLVEDERLLSMLLLGPSRRRVMWEQVRGVKVDGRSLRVDTVDGPWVTAQGATPDDLEALRVKIEAARAKARDEAVAGG